MKRSKWIFLVAMLSSVALLGAACGGDDGGGTAGGDGGCDETIPVSVHYQGALSGAYSYLVIPGFQGAQIAADELNADENFCAEITLEKADTQGDPAQAPPVVQKVVEDPNTVAVAGPGFSGESLASGDSYEEAGIPFVTPSATNPTIADEGWTFWYRAIGNDAGQGSNAGRYIARVLESKKLFISHDKSDYGQPLAEVVRDTASEEGVEIVGEEGIETGKDDYSALISSIEASGADTLFFGGYDADFGKIVTQLRDAGLEVTPMSGDGSVSSTFIEIAGDAADGTHLIIPSNLGGDFVEKYNSEVGSDASSVPVYAAEGYDVMGMIGEGIQQAIDGGATDAVSIREGIQEYLLSLASGEVYEGAAKDYEFDEKHELAAEPYDSLYYFYEVQGGEMTAVGNAVDVLGL